MIIDKKKFCSLEGVNLMRNRRVKGTLITSAIKAITHLISEADFALC
jgi:hypothetical protein